MTREQRWLRAELKLLRDDGWRTEQLPDHLRRHYRARAATIRRILAIVKAAQRRRLARTS